LIKEYDLELTDIFVNAILPTKEIKGIYKSRKKIYKKLLVIDKENGGKADALNAGINLSQKTTLFALMWIVFWNKTRFENGETIYGTNHKACYCYWRSDSCSQFM
jgi:hypothetical protein